MQKVNEAIESTDDDDMKNDLINLRCDIEELVLLTEKSLKEIENKTKAQASCSKQGVIDDEYLQFMVK